MTNQNPFTVSFDDTEVEETIARMTYNNKVKHNYSLRDWTYKSYLTSDMSNLEKSDIIEFQSLLSKVNGKTALIDNDKRVIAHVEPIMSNREPTGRFKITYREFKSASTPEIH